MTWWEILLIAAAAGFVVAVAVTSIIRRKRGKGSCCDCGGKCSACAYCKQKTSPEKTDHTQSP